MWEVAAEQGAGVGVTGEGRAESNSPTPTTIRLMASLAPHGEEGITSLGTEPLLPHLRAKALPCRAEEGSKAEPPPR